MKRVMNVILISLIIFSFFVFKLEKRYVHERNKYDIKYVTTYDLLKQNELYSFSDKTRIINPVNMISEQIKLYEINVDIDALYYAMIEVGLKDIVEKLSMAYNVTKDHNLKEISDYIIVNGFTDRFEFTEMIKKYPLTEGQFVYTNILKTTDNGLSFEGLRKNRSYKFTENIYFYEDFDLDKMYFFTYKVVNTYGYLEDYVVSINCDLDTPTHKKTPLGIIRNGELLIDEEYYKDTSHLVNENKDGIVCFEQKLIDLDLKEIEYIYEENIHYHQDVTTFNYQSDTTKPYAKINVITDYFGNTKIALSDNKIFYKITDEAHYLRNYNNLYFQNDKLESLYQVYSLYPSNIRSEFFRSDNNYFHELLRRNNNNKKYLKNIEYYDIYYKDNKRGSLELILNGNEIVYEYFVEGTFNYGRTSSEHYVKDVYPYLVLGNTREDGHTALERFVWDKDRFTRTKYGRNLEGKSLFSYYNNLKEVFTYELLIPDVIFEKYN